jgi:hypothetical protein
VVAASKGPQGHQLYHTFTIQSRCKKWRSKELTWSAFKHDCVCVCCYWGWWWYENTLDISELLGKILINYQLLCLIFMTFHQDSCQMVIHLTYSWSFRFKSWPGIDSSHWFFCLFSESRQITGWFLQLDRGRFVSHRFQIHYSLPSYFT